MNNVVVENEKGVVTVTVGSRLRVGKKIRTRNLIMPGIYAPRHHGTPDGISLGPISTGCVEYVFPEYQSDEINKGKLAGVVFTEFRRGHPAVRQRSAIGVFHDQHFRKASYGHRLLTEIQLQPPLPGEKQSLPFSRLRGGQTGFCNRFAAAFLTGSGKSPWQQ